jgi:hypothetical protein
MRRRSLLWSLSIVRVQDEIVLFEPDGQTMVDPNVGASTKIVISSGEPFFY